MNNWAKSRWANGKTFTEFRIKALELLEGHDTFKAQKKIDQNRLVAAMDLIIGRKPAKDASIPINQMKQTVRLLRDNNWKSNIKAAKFSLNNAVKFL